MFREALYKLATGQLEMSSTTVSPGRRGRHAHVDAVHQRVSSPFGDEGLFVVGALGRADKVLGSGNRLGVFLTKCIYLGLR